MHAAFSTVDITPTHPVPLAGYTRRQGVFTGIDTPLEANLIGMAGSDGEGVMLGSVDTLFVGSSAADQIARAAGIARERLFLVASHTHNAPSLAPEVPRLGCYDAAYGESTIGCIGDAARRLFAGLTEAVSAAYAECHAPFNVSRRRPAWVLDYKALYCGRRLRFGRAIAMAAFDRGIVDPMLRCIVLRDRHRRVRGVIWSYACHPAFFPHSTLVSPDFPGLVRSHLRTLFGPTCVVVYLPGFAGSTIPRIPFTLPRSTRQLVSSLLPFHPGLRSFTPAAYYTWTAKIARTAAACVAEAPMAEGGSAVRHRQVHSRDVFITPPSDGSENIGLTAARLDFGPSCGLLAVTGEMIAEWTSLLPRRSLDRRIATGYLAGPCFYVPTDAAIRQGGYEADGFRSWFNLDGRFAAGMDEIVTDAVNGLFDT
jgi:hypothetical protein